MPSPQASPRPLFAPLRDTPERWLFTAFTALLLAPMIAQGLQRPIALVLTGPIHSIPLTVSALLVALAAWVPRAARPTPRPVLAWLPPALVAAALTATLHLGAAGLLSLLPAAAASGALSSWLPQRLPDALDGLLARRRVLAALYVLLALISVVQVARVSVFIADPTRTEAQIVPGIKFLETHSCLTAYVRARDLAHDRVDNLYLAERWPVDLHVDPRPETPYSPFDLDEFFYPPPFLLIAEILAPLRGDFLAQRAAWFGLNGLFLAASFWLAARKLGGPHWHRPLLLAPLLLASLPVLSVLQIGNAQGLVVAIALLAMLAFDADRPALGGAPLAIASLAKLSPGIFFVILLVQKRWRAAAWTAGLSLGLLVLALVAYGTDPLVSWVTYAAPRLSSGLAFSPMLHHPESIALNLSPAGAPFKLALLGVNIADPWPIARRINQLFTVLLVVVTVVLARRHPLRDAATRPARSLAWLALLFLASLRSPFAPGYVTFAFVWLLTLLSTEVKTLRGGLALIGLFALTTILPPLPTPQLALYTLFLPLLPMGVSLWLLLRRPPAAR
ncbi:MAG: glycosyltransferase family 87 protein [Polyangiaceae bacterium]